MIWVFSLSKAARITAAVLAALVLISFASTASAKKAIPPTPEDLFGVWVGFDDDELRFSRLELRPDLTGYLARVSPGDTILHDIGVSVYRVTNWKVEGWNVGISLIALTSNAEAMQIRGQYNGFSLRLKISGTNGFWERKVILNREERETAANRETREKIQELERRKQ